MTVRLSNVAEINPRLLSRPSDDTDVSFLGMAGVDAQTGTTTTGQTKSFGEVSKGYTFFQDGDLLLAKITPCFENGKIAQAKLDHGIGVGSTEFLVIRPDPARAHDRYLLHFLRQPHLRRAGERRMTGSGGQRRVPASFLAGLQVPLPPIEEQRRIAEVLDRADALRAKRREALALLDDLTQSIFLDMFGDPVSNPKGWQVLRVEDTLAAPLRNGLSPSGTGTVSGQVLTLSAVTGKRFKSDASKPAFFDREAACDQRVRASDLLICRGNGNLRLVGRGFFPEIDLPNVAYPDTIISARIDVNVVSRRFMQQVWNSKSVRRQIESSARTTNGTFKINQSMIRETSFIVPNRGLQEQFEQRVINVDLFRSNCSAHLVELDSLFVSLQHHAFCGHL